ncbi:MAG: hypothetical protein J3R72DRAFT_430559 [Linnemannia gamsii]|nr:MAG: hypothetical protein J3R72DRAFT_430559 [Linnemannia gamsii]
MGPTPSPTLTEQETLLVEAYQRVLNDPFEDKYDDRWQDEPFDKAIEEFKARALEIGFAEPLDVLKQFRVESYEAIRKQHKQGPALCFRPGWKSPLLGQLIDPVALVAKCQFVSGPTFNGEGRVILLDFWASWCDPCVQAGPEMSDLADEFEGRIMVIGINNESIFGVTKPADVDHLNTFLHDNQEGFRYTIYIDNDEGHAKESVYNPAGYRGIPCVVLLVDGIVTYVGSPQENFRSVLEQTLDFLETEALREE